MGVQTESFYPWPIQNKMYEGKYPVHPMSAKQCALSLINGPCRYLWGWRWLFWVETGDGQVPALEKADGRHCGWKMEQKPGCFPLWDTPLKQICQLKCCAAQWQFFLGVQSNNKLKMLWKIHSWPIESRAVFGCCIFVKEKMDTFYFFLVQTHSLFLLWLSHMIQAVTWCTAELPSIWFFFNKILCESAINSFRIIVHEPLHAMLQN